MPMVATMATATIAITSSRCRLAPPCSYHHLGGIDFCFASKHSTAQRFQRSGIAYSVNLDVISCVKFDTSDIRVQLQNLVKELLAFPVGGCKPAWKSTIGQQHRYSCTTSAAVSDFILSYSSTLLSTIRPARIFSDPVSFIAADNRCDQLSDGAHARCYRGCSLTARFIGIVYG